MLPMTTTSRTRQRNNHTPHPNTAHDPGMTDEEIRAQIATRPEATLQERAANAAYENALELQAAGIPSSVRAGQLVAFSRVWKVMEKELETELAGIAGGE